MKTTALEKIEIPSEVKEVTKFSRSTQNMTESSCDMPTGIAAKFVSSIWLTGGSAVGSSAVLSAIPDVAGGFYAIPGTLGVISGLITLFVGVGAVIVGDDSFSDMKDEFKEIKKGITPAEWKENSAQRFRIYSKSRRSAVLNMLLPRRIFKRVLMNETVWYSPSQDIYTLEKHYLTATNWVTETAEVDGRRRVFTKALESF